MEGLAGGPRRPVDQRSPKNELAQCPCGEEHEDRETRDSEHGSERSLEGNREERAPAEDEERRREEPERGGEGTRRGRVLFHI